jgi:hypothetical protein
LELSGVVSALSAEVNITNDGSQTFGGGLLITDTNQFVGNIDGAGEPLHAIRRLRAVSADAAVGFAA